MCKYVITYDIGTTGIKTCLIEIDDEMKILGSATAGYGLYVDEEAGGVKGGAEQDADEWWEAMCITTKTVFDKVPNVKKSKLKVSAFALQCRDLFLLTRRAIAFAVL